MSAAEVRRALAGYYCCTKGRHLATELTRAEADLRTAARKRERSPERPALTAEVERAKTYRQETRARIAEHEIECSVGELCPHEPPCDTEQECAERACDLCRDGEPCREHRDRANESAAIERAERNRS